MKKLILLMALVMLAGISAMKADEYVPQVREGVEWGYINLKFGPGGNFGYYRLQFKGKTEINGKVYYNLYKYDTFFLFETPYGIVETPIAWMREENKKVYAIMNPEYENLFKDSLCTIFDDANGEEVLLMDYGVSLNQKFVLGHEGNEYEAECVDIKTVSFDGVDRKQFTIKILSPYYGSYSDTFELVEGVGPVSYEFGGEGSFIFVFPAQLQGGFGGPDEGWLYEREIIEPEISDAAPELDVYKMGKFIMTSPIFERCGVHDPTVWYWMESEGIYSGVDTAVENDEVEMRISDGKLIFSSGSVSKVNVYQADGMLLDVITAAGGEAPFRFDKYGHKVLILTAVMTDGRTIVRKVASR